MVRSLYGCVRMCACVRACVCMCMCACVPARGWVGVQARTHVCVCACVCSMWFQKWHHVVQEHTLIVGNTTGTDVGLNSSPACVIPSSVHADSNILGSPAAALRHHLKFAGRHIWQQLLVLRGHQHPLLPFPGACGTDTRSTGTNLPCMTRHAGTLRLRVPA